MVDKYKTVTLVESTLWSSFNVEDNVGRKREERGDGIDGGGMVKSPSRFYTHSARL